MPKKPKRRSEGASRRRGPRDFSETLLDFMTPLLTDVVSVGGGFEMAENAVRVAVDVWNAAVLEAVGIAPGIVAEARAAVAQIPEEEGTALQRVDRLFERRFERFADDHRLVGLWNLQRDAVTGAFRLRAHERRLPKTRG